MNSHEVARQLLALPDTELLIFAEGRTYPALKVQLFDGFAEIGCGWVELEENTDV